MLDTGMIGSTDKYDILQACRRLLLEDLNTILRHAGVYDRPALEAMQEASGKLFDELAAASRKGSFEEEADGLTASRISLMPESALELDIQLGDLSRRLLDNQGEHLRKVYLRFVTLLNRPEMPTEDNPAGIDTIVEGLRALFMALGRSTDEAIALLDPIEDSFKQLLPNTYSRMGEILESHGVAPAIARIQSSATKSAPPQGAPANFAATGMFAAPSTSPLGSLQAAMLARQAPAATGATIGVPVASAQANLSPETLNRLLERLAALESRAQTPPANSDPGSSSAERLPTASDLGLHGAEAATIDTLGAIFSVIFDEPELPAALKASIASLQISMVKAAILDSGFFTNPGHPARRLLDAMGHCASNLAGDTSFRHPVITKISNVAQQVRTADASDPATFENAIAQLEALASERSQTSADATPGYLSLAKQLHQEAVKDAEVATAVEQLLDGNPPSELVSLIRGEWAQVLQSVARDEGTASTVWSDCLDVMRKLLWSINPMQNPDQRKQLASQVPAIIRGLNAGFDRIQLPQADRERILDLCFALQTAALRGVPVSSPAAASTATAVDFDLSALAGPGDTLSLPAFEQREFPDGRKLKIWRGEQKDSDAASVPLEMLSRPGDWLELKLPDNTLARGQWTATDEVSGQLLIQNPDWEHALLLSPDVLKYQLRSKQARVLRPRSLFEEAANQALQQVQRS